MDSDPRGLDCTVAVCRFCLEEGSTSTTNTPDDARLVSPCACRGTSMLVHLGCLRRWQESLLSGELPSAELLQRVSTCQVCQNPLMVDGQAFQPLRLVDSGTPVPVRPGTLLTATRNLEDTDFRCSVILICQVKADYVFGVDLTRILEDTSDPVLTVLQAAGVSSLEVHVLHGGPVSNEQSSIREYMVLATHSEQGCSEIIWAPSRSEQGLYFAVPLARGPALQFMNRKATRMRAAPSRRESIHVFRGYTAWSRHQLQDEISLGVWAASIGELADVFKPPGELWSNLWESGRVSRAGPVGGTRRVPNACTCTCL